jgi:DNA-binding CsgD family transcriptional regulator
MAAFASAGDRVTPLIERDAELAAVFAALSSARAGAGSLLLIEGVAGIGKTALVDAARERAEQDAMRVLHARATELEREYPFGVVRQCLGPLVRHDEDRERLLRGAAQLAEPVLVGVPESVDSAPLGLLHGLHWLVANLADETPTLVAVDDAHWADEASLRFLAYLARRLEALRVAVVIATRPDEEALGATGRVLAELRSEAARKRLAPQPLAPDGVQALLLELAGGPVDEDFARACREATGGNPFLVEELARTLEADGVPFTAASVGRVGSVTPTGVAGAVAATLGRLGPPAAALAQAAAVLGDGAPLDLAAALTDMPVAEAATAAAELVRAGLLQDGRELRFRHPILAGAASATQSEAERAAAHSRAAELLRARGAPPERVALQLLHTPPADNQETVAELRRAADSARDRGAPATAAVLLERALAEPPAAEARAGLLVALGRARLAAGAAIDAAEHLAEAYRCATDPLTRGLAVMLLGATPGDRAHQRQIVEMAASTLPEVQERDADLAMRLRGLVVLGGRGVELPDVTGATAGEAVYLGHLVFALMRPGASAAEVADAALRAARQVDALLEQGASWLGFTGMTLGLIWTDHLEEAERVADRAIAEARRQGSVTDFASSMTWRANVHRRAGRLREAEADARAALDAALDPDWAFARGAAPLACTLVGQGRADDAARELAAVVSGEEIADSPQMLPVLLARMWVRAARRDLAGALADWEEARRRLARGANAGLIEDFAVAADVQAAAGERAGAAATAGEALDLAQAWGTPGARGMALHTQARVSDDGDAIDLLRSAVELLGASPVRLGEARARVSLGAALRRAGHRVDSRDPLREGYELAQRCGALALAETARSELRASGIRLRREVATGADALTPSERRIADMAAAGLSNPEIAQELFLTVKTIEMHLTRVYRKLDIRRRGKLARALGA